VIHSPGMQGVGPPTRDESRFGAWVRECGAHRPSQGPQDSEACAACYDELKFRYTPISSGSMEDAAAGPHGQWR